MCTAGLLTLPLAAVLDAIQAGQLRHIFLVGGCDAAEPSRRYYTDVVKGLPQDTMVRPPAAPRFEPAALMT
jgi:hydroxylamine reductase